MISVYIHVPFCANKCPYCGFYSTQYDSPLADRYVDALEIELKNRASFLRSHHSTSVYIGGGTPTVLSLAQISHLFDLIDKYIIRTDDAEVTIEVNPNTASAGTFSLLMSRGVNRLSIGVQSFSDTVLASLGRAHSADDAFTAFHAARTAGCSNIGIDLIYGVPRQTEQQWQHTLECSIALGPEHVSLYSLSLDEGSQLSREVAAGKMLLPEEDRVARMYQKAIRCLADAEYQQYEISNFSLPGRECRHNNNYWARGEYLGFGPGATSFIGSKRFTTIANVSEYSSRMKNGLDAVGSSEVLEHDQEVSEMLLLGLRRNAGIDLEHFGREFGPCALDDLIKRLKLLDESGLFQIHGSRLSFTTHGFLLSNSALAAILP